ncbi:16S rRNA (uracil(1498)-N(3))-methyltransferase [Nitrosomonas aestuarii]|uniref:16S rRNA (uracil(1498)-N(3))-methyltransferase n=1 Tax=Nitrosomonas aestuarii TaxID=52441 RepID=UPI000D4E96C8|nr:16S rRNA (uracil(1498)-N(3))-methyltransferase [Nitrosomonas aestuarii]PTN09451.1 16S rRNA (uracil1498-N3)-methyltransferase [Nitrosomonas aestuarii]
MILLLTYQTLVMPPRLFHDGEICAGKTVELEMNTGHHATRVLRIKAGDSVILFNGKGGEFSGRIERIQKTSTQVIIDQFNAIERESPLAIELVQAICVNEKMDLIIQKSVELGVTCIQPVTTARSIVRLSEERAMKRLRHWQRVIISACEQCGRNFIPTIFPLVALTHWINNRDTKPAHHLNFMLSTTGNESLKNLTRPSVNTHLTLTVGPEGGLTSEEEIILQQADFTPLRVGKRTLRTETAALATIAALQMRWGDF